MSTVSAAFDPGAHGWERQDLPGFAQLAGPFWRREAQGCVHYGLLVEDKHGNLGGVAHGGLLMTVFDTGLGLMLAEDGSGRRVTISLDVQFLAPAPMGAFLIVEGEVVRKGRSMAFLRGTLRHGDVVCATAQGIWKTAR